MNRVVVQFKPKSAGMERDEEFELTLSKKISYESVAQQVGEHLKFPGNKIRFTASTQSGQSKQPLRRHNSQTLAEMIQPGYTPNATNLLYYELLEVTLAELETKKSVKVTWMGLHNKEEGLHTYLMAKTANLHDVIDNLAKDIKFAKEGGTQKIRIFEVPSGGRMQKLYSGGELIKDMTTQTLEDLYAEEIPIEEANVTEEERVITCYHFAKDPTRFHGVPFRFVLKKDEPFSETRKRIQLRLGMGDKEFSKIKCVFLA